jgi:CBS domain containing-hemolysin-like protein
MPASKRVIRLMSDPRKFHLSILIGNALSTILTATTATLFVLKVIQNSQLNRIWVLGLTMVIVTLVLLLLSRIPSKILSVRNPRALSQKLSLINNLTYLLIYPVSALLERATVFMGRILKVEGDPFSLSEEEVKSMIELGEEKGTIHTEEKEMIRSIFQFSETMAKEIMVPRIDMVCLAVTSSVDELIRITREKGHSRIPIYEGRIDNIKGIIHVKDLIPELRSNREKVSLQDLAKPAFFVPENKKIDDLLGEFRQEKIHMAIVVDEYGGTAGLVTLEDVIEEIVGEIQDEYDKELPLYRKISPDTFLVDGRIAIDELNEVLPEPILQSEEEDFETLGGLIYHITESIPSKSDFVSYMNYDFVIEDVDRQRIKKVKVIHKADKDEEPPDNNK